MVCGRVYAEWRAQQARFRSCVELTGLKTRILHSYILPQHKEVAGVNDMENRDGRETISSGFSVRQKEETTKYKRIPVVLVYMMAVSMLVLLPVIHVYSQTVVNAPASVDSWLNSAANTTTYGSNTTMEINSGGANLGHALPVMKSDLSSISSVSTINSINLKLISVACDNINYRIVGVYQLTREWVQTQIIWARALKAIEWKKSGEDYYPTVLATKTVTDYGQHSFLSDSLMPLVPPVLCSWLVGPVVVLIMSQVKETLSKMAGTATLLFGFYYEPEMGMKFSSLIIALAIPPMVYIIKSYLPGISPKKLVRHSICMVKVKEI